MCVSVRACVCVTVLCLDIMIVVKQLSLLDKQSLSFSITCEACLTMGKILLYLETGRVSSHSKSASTNTNPFLHGKGDFKMNLYSRIFPFLTQSSIGNVTVGGKESSTNNLAGGYHKVKYPALGHGIELVIPLAKHLSHHQYINIERCYLFINRNIKQNR